MAKRHIVDENNNCQWSKKNLSPYNYFGRGDRMISVELFREEVEEHGFLVVASRFCEICMRFIERELLVLEYEWL